MANLPVGQPGFRPKDNKYQPAKLSDRNRDGQSDCKKCGSEITFNAKGKTNDPGGDYMNSGNPLSGLEGNYSEKDSSVEYLRDRGKQGITVHHFSGGNLKSKASMENHGVTAYPSSPIGQVYKPGTGQNFGRIKHPTQAVGEAPGDPIVRPKITKSEEA